MGKPLHEIQLKHSRILIENSLRRLNSSIKGLEMLDNFKCRDMLIKNIHGDYELKQNIITNQLLWLENELDTMESEL